MYAMWGETRTESASPNKNVLFSPMQVKVVVFPSSYDEKANFK